MGVETVSDPILGQDSPPISEPVLVGIGMFTGTGSRPHGQLDGRVRRFSILGLHRAGPRPHEARVSRGSGWEEVWKFGMREHECPLDIVGLFGP